MTIERLAFVLLVATLPGCDGCSKVSQAAAEAVETKPTIDQFEQLKDGESRTFRVRAGSYRLQVTATADGAGVTWAGPQCQNAKETRVYDSNCTLDQDGQLTISNPTTFGLGATSTVTIKLTPQ